MIWLVCAMLSTECLNTLGACITIPYTQILFESFVFCMKWFGRFSSLLPFYNLFGMGFRWDCLIPEIVSHGNLPNIKQQLQQRTQNRERTTSSRKKCSKKNVFIVVLLHGKHNRCGNYATAMNWHRFNRNKSRSDSTITKVELQRISWKWFPCLLLFLFVSFLLLIFGKQCRKSRSKCSVEMVLLVSSLWLPTCSMIELNWSI